MLLVGRITGAYGIKGWVKVHAFTDPVENLFSFSQWIARSPAESRNSADSASQGVKDSSNGDRRSGRDSENKTLIFSEFRRQGRGLIAKLEGVDDRTGAERLRGLEIWVPEVELPPLESGDYYWHQLENLRVYSRYPEHGSAGGEAPDPRADEEYLLGEVDHLLETGANDVLVLRPCEGSLDDRERLVPYLPGSVVQRVSLDERRIDVLWHPED